MMAQKRPSGIGGGIGGGIGSGIGGGLRKPTMLKPPSQTAASAQQNSGSAGITGSKLANNNKVRSDAMANGTSPKNAAMRSGIGGKIGGGASERSLLKPNTKNNRSSTSLSKDNGVNRRGAGS